LRDENETRTQGEVKMTKVIWIVWVDDVELARVSTQRMARAIAHELGGYVTKYTVEYN
jgi:hypothetical protein